MIPISQAFRDELAQPIRRRGHCQIWFVFSGETPVEISEYYVKSVEVKLTGDVLSRRLPEERCTIVLLDYQRRWDVGATGNWVHYLNKGMSASIRFGIETASGSTVWSPYQEYKLKDYPTWKNYTAKFVLERTLATLTAPFGNIKAWITNVGALADDAANGNYDRVATPVTIRTDFNQKLYDNDIIRHATMSGKKCNDVLLACALASRCGLRTKYDGTVQIKDFYGWIDSDADQNPAVVTMNDMMEFPTMERLPLLRKCYAKYLTDPVNDGSRVTVFDISGDASPTTDNPLVVQFSDQIAGSELQIDTQTNVSSMVYTVFRDHIEFTNITRTNSSSPYRISGSGFKVGPVTITQASRVSTGVVGTEDETVENPLLNRWNSTFFAIDNVPDYRATVLMYARDMYSFPYRGDPSIEAYDHLTVELPGIGNSECIVLESVFKFEAGFSGSLIVRRLEQPQ